ncbi:hypothetical protein NX10_01390 [Pseudomonas fluorescens]|nr:hypothetical protein NX10_01390 [Pseudomonas fluorescens]
MVFSFDRKRGGRIDARVEKLGIIRCEDGLANLSRQDVDMWYKKSAFASRLAPTRFCAGHTRYVRR